MDDRAAAQPPPFRRSLRPALSALPTSAPLWGLNTLVVGLALGMYLLHVDELGALMGPVQLRWWALAPLFYAAEMCAVHLHFRRDAHTFTLSELPLVLGLFFAAPDELVLARLVATVAVLGAHSRQRPLKLVFNLALFSLEAETAVAIFQRLGAHLEPLGPIGWAAAFPATLLTSLLGVSLIFVAISVSERSFRVDKLAQVAGFAAIVTATNTSLGLVVVAALWKSPQWAWLLLVPAATLFVAYRGYGSARRQHESLEFLYEATRIVHQSQQVESAIVALLHHTRAMFRSEMAQITLFSSPQEHTALRTTLGPGDEVVVMKPVDVITEEFLSELSSRKGAMLLGDGMSPTPPAGVVDGRMIDDGMIAPLLGETRVIGTILVANRLGEASSFDVDDLKLFQTLANHVSVSLEKGRLEQSLAQLTEVQKQLEHQALHDSLTDLANRVLFNDRVHHAVAGLRRRGGPISVLFLDLDDFKVVNDSLGHAAGDRLLVSVAERIQAGLRPTDTAARLGGDEFAILLEDVEDPGDALKVAERIKQALRAPIRVEGNEVFVQASIGIAFTASGDEEAAELLRNADVAMYRAKDRGKGSCELFHSQMHAAVVERLELEADLRRAVERDEFTAYYQPIVSLTTGRTVGMEALVRWQHPQRGLLAPEQFISSAEQTGLILPIGRSMLEQACRHTRRWQALYNDQVVPSISVNLSMRQLQEPGLVEEISEILRDTELYPHSLILEITESGLMQNLGTTRHTLDRLKGLGVRLAIDDFGTGYSSLGYLEHFPVDILKVDKTFIDAVGGPNDAALARAIITLGSSLELRVVAEGVERAEQVAPLRNLGCELGQGYLFSKPVPAEAMESVLQEECERNEITARSGAQVPISM